MAKEKEQRKPHAPRVVNRKARHDYHVLETVECGMELLGTEVKSILARAGEDRRVLRPDRRRAVVADRGEHAQYQHAGPLMQHEPNRDRRLLIHRRQLASLTDHLRQKGKTLSRWPCISRALGPRSNWAWRSARSSTPAPGPQETPGPARHGLCDGKTVAEGLTEKRRARSEERRAKRGATSEGAESATPCGQVARIGKAMERKCVGVP